MIEALHGRRGVEIAEDEGVARLHRIEAEVLDEALGFVPPSVIAAAASVADKPVLIDRMATPGVVVVLLECDPATLEERRQAESHRRPIGRSESDNLAQRRRASIRPIADLVLDVRDLAPVESARRIIEEVRSRSG